MLVLVRCSQVALQPALHDVGLHGVIALEALVPTSIAVLLEANIHRVAPGGSSRGLIQHQGEEMGFVLEGKIELNVQGKKVSVSKGDTFFFQSHLKHGYCNTGKKEAQIVWINTPQSF